MNAWMMETVEMAWSMKAATIADCWRSDARRGEARPWEMPVMRMRMGAVKGIMMVSAHERERGKLLMSIPEASEVAIRTLSVSLNKTMLSWDKK